MESQTIEHGDGEDKSHTWRYRCMPCVKRELNFQTDALAWAYIYETQGKSSEKIRQAAKFADAKRCIKASYEAVGIIKGNRAVYQFTRCFMTELFSGIASFIVFKSRQMIDDLRSKDSIPNLAFEGSKEHNLAASFTDEWVKTSNGHFRHYYICMAGSAADPCLHMIASKMWPRLFDTEAWAKGQRYYCRTNTWGQEHRYHAKYGVIVEIKRNRNIYYCRGSVPDETKHDILAQHYEALHGRNLTPAELYDRIPIIMPTTTAMVIPVNEAKGVYKLTSLEAYNSLPVWSWNQNLQLGQ